MPTKKKNGCHIEVGHWLWVRPGSIRSGREIVSDPGAADGGCRGRRESSCYHLWFHTVDLSLALHWQTVGPAWCRICPRPLGLALQEKHPGPEVQFLTLLPAYQFIGDSSVRSASSEKPCYGPRETAGQQTSQVVFVHVGRPQAGRSHLAWAVVVRAGSSGSLAGHPPEEALALSVPWPLGVLRWGAQCPGSWADGPLALFPEAQATSGLCSPCGCGGRAWP